MTLRERNDTLFYKVKRVNGITFDIGVFLNISEDHISDAEHPNFEDYLNELIKENMSFNKLIYENNDEAVEANKVKITYNDYPNTLFAGQTDVIDGQFEFTFMVPKDIRYNYGHGRIVYYAYDNESKEEGIGYYEDFIIGGTSTVAIQDTIGPDIRVYLNTPEFQDGGTTYEFPQFFAEVYDENGINTVGTGIGHDLLMVIDGNPKHTYVLNEYFVADNNSYQQGTISYKMPEMEDGQHTLTFRAWDLINNSSIFRSFTTAITEITQRIYY